MLALSTTERESSHWKGKTKVVLCGRWVSPERDSWTMKGTVAFYNGRW